MPISPVTPKTRSIDRTRRDTDAEKRPDRAPRNRVQRHLRQQGRKHSQTVLPVEGWYSRSQVNLADPDDFPMLYARVVERAAIFPQDIKRVLVLGLGAGSIPVYLDRFLPDAAIDTVELDPGVIDVAKKYFGLRETKKFHLIESDARVFLNRHTEPYDLIMVDAYTGSYIPFHLMTKEFYQLVRDRLAPHGVAAVNILPV